MKMLPTTVGSRLSKHEREAAMGNKGNPARVSMKRLQLEC